MLADRSYDADWLRDALEQKGVKPCIPGCESSSMPVKYDKRRCKRRNRIEIMFGRLVDWRRAASGYDRCPTVTSPQSHSLQPCSSGCDQSVVSLGGHPTGKPAAWTDHLGARINLSQYRPTYQQNIAILLQC